MGIALFDDSGDDDTDLSKIEINKDFAKRFEHNKKREALQRCEELKKRGFIADSDDSDDSSDESLEINAVKKDIQFYDALVRVKRNDPTILQKEAKLFLSSSEDEDDEADENKTKSAKKVKPLYLKDVMAMHLIDDGPDFEEEPLQKNPKVYSREQAEGLKAFLEAEEEAFACGDDDETLIKQKSSMKDIEVDENAENIHKKLDEFFGEDGDVSGDERFLKNYCLNKMWADRENDKIAFDDIGVSEDEDELERQDHYEADYNFRHEEGQDDRVLGHSRVIQGSVRKKSNSRNTQRKNKEERMAHAEFERKEVLKHMKNLKKKEIQEKLERIRTTAGIAGGSSCNLDVSHLEEDFDPDEYDKAMKEMFDSNYYNTEDVDPGFGSDGSDDLEKPDFDKEDELLGLIKGCDSHDTMEGFEDMRKAVMKKNNEDEEPSTGEAKRKISLREKAELDKELDEYYKLDYEGTVGDLKTRFKYRSVPACTYGLQTEEVLMANDKDLNQYVSLKKLAPYREKEWKVTYHQKLKKNTLLQGVKSDGKMHDMKQRKGEIKTSTAVDTLTESKEANEDENALSKRSRKRQKHAQLKLSKQRLMAYGKIPSKKHKKL